jgi:predicted aconitase
MELTREEESALKGEQGEIMQMAYRILVATGDRKINSNRMGSPFWS